MEQQKHLTFIELTRILEEQRLELIHTQVGALIELLRQAHLKRRGDAVLFIAQFVAHVQGNKPLEDFVKDYPEARSFDLSEFSSETPIELENTQTETIEIEDVIAEPTIAVEVIPLAQKPVAENVPLSAQDIVEGLEINRLISEAGLEDVDWLPGWIQEYKVDTLVGKFIATNIMQLRIGGGDAYQFFYKREEFHKKKTASELGITFGQSNTTYLTIEDCLNVLAKAKNSKVGLVAPR